MSQTHAEIYPGGCCPQCQETLRRERDAAYSDVKLLKGFLVDLLESKSLPAWVEVDIKVFWKRHPHLWGE